MSSGTKNNESSESAKTGQMCDSHIENSTAHMPCVAAMDSLPFITLPDDAGSFEEQLILSTLLPGQPYCYVRSVTVALCINVPHL